jgi:hypothetical protein
MTITAQWFLPKEADWIACEEDEEEVEDTEDAGNQYDEPYTPLDPGLFSDSQEHQAERDLDQAGRGHV